MKIQITRLTDNLLPATRAFNARLGPDAPFLLPETMPNLQSGEPSSSDAISWAHYIALDGSTARGGFLRMDQPAWLNGETHPVSNYQSVLSEGLRDRKYGVVSVHILKYLEHQTPNCFMVGMGNVENPLPRLLKASGWTLRPVPFQFRIQNVRNFLGEMYIFRQKNYLRIAARVASISGAAWLGIKALQARPFVSPRGLSTLAVERFTKWGSWADEIWAKYRTQCSFAVVRDKSTLELLYPSGQNNLAGLLVRESSRPIGWATWLDTPMKNDRYFGNLRLISILDCVAVPEFIDNFAHRLTGYLAELKADLLITNQYHFLWTSAFRKAGFLTAPSNYLLATSKVLSGAIASSGGEKRIHLTRGDGDGRIHL